jgi:hypothetical protein
MVGSNEPTIFYFTAVRRNSMIRLTITNGIKGYKENLVIDCPTLEHKINMISKDCYQQDGDLFSLGELLEILISEGAEVVLKQLRG